MMGLARKILRHDWRRYVPATLAVTFSGVLVIVQVALVLGVFAGASVYVTASRGDLWVGYPGTQSVDLGRPIPAIAEMSARLDPRIKRVERFRWIDGDWRAATTHGGISVFVTGIDTQPEGLVFARALTIDQRLALREPGSAIVDPADLDKLGIRVGDHAEINGHHVHVIDSAHGVRALGGVNVVTSLETARQIDPTLSDRVAYLVLSLNNANQADEVIAHLTPPGDAPTYSIWRSDAFAALAVRFWLFDTGAGLAFLFGALVVCLAGIAITSQSLTGAVIGNVREYATLRALGVSYKNLRKIVLEQALWVSAGGLVLAVLVSGILLFTAHWIDVPVTINLVSAALVGVVILTIALSSGVIAMRALRRADPILLLR